MFAGPPSARPARPVADDAVRELAGESSELAKGWLLALLAGQPLEVAPRLAGELIHSGAGRLCEAVVLALGSDGDLRALGPAGELEALARDAALAAGGGSLEGALAALATLSRTIWAAVRRALADPEPELVADLAARLARVDETLRAAVLRAVATPPGPDQPPSPPESTEAPELINSTEAPGPIESTEAPGPIESVAPIDSTEPPTADTARAQVPAAVDPGSEPVNGSRPPAVAPGPAQRGRLQRARPGAGAPLWRAAIEEEVARRRGGALALLLVELVDAERVSQIEAQADAGAVLARFAHALRASMRREDIVAAERAGRAWVLAPGADRRCATALAQRIELSVQAARHWRGAPMRAAVGIAILGEDGESAGQLCERAEESMLAAMAAGAATVLQEGEPGGAMP